MQWRASGYQGHQVVALAHSEQGCALVGLCLSMCEVGVRAEPSETRVCFMAPSLRTRTPGARAL